jgi:predicted amidophosphoribosyltransferase
VLNVLDAYWIAAKSADRRTSIVGDDSRTCPNCGKELEPDIDFCHWCTTQLDGDTDEE